MALPAVVAGAAKGLKVGGKILGKAGKRIGKEAKRVPLFGRGRARPRESPEDEEARKTTALLTPEGTVMLSLAVMLDIFGVLCLIMDVFFGLGEIPSWISGAVGIIFIGGWMLFRSGRMAVPGRAKKRVGRGLRKVFQGKWKRFLTPILGEVTPVIGGLPFWTLAVYYELTS